MGSPNVEDRIAKVLRRHIWYFVGNLGVPGMPDQKGYKCYCGWQVDSTGGDTRENDPYIHVAAALVDELHTGRVQANSPRAVE